MSERAGDSGGPAETSSHGAEATTLAPASARPGDERFLTHLAAAGELVAAQKFREAEVEALRALSGLPADLRALNLLALVRFKLGRLEEARATYREIATAAPNDPHARRNLGLLALKLERMEEAIPELEMAARLSPADQRAWSYLGYAYAKRGDVVAAAAAFRRAGQDALATELENAATARRPPSGPSLAALQPSAASPAPPAPARPETGSSPSVASPRPAASAAAPAPAARASAVAPAAAVSPAPAPVAAAAPPVPPAPAPVAASAPPRAAAPAPAPAMPAAPVPSPAFFGEVAAAEPEEVSPADIETVGGGEVAPVPLVSFVLSRLGLAPPPRSPRDEALRLVVDEEAHVRADAVLAAMSLRWEVAHRRVQGRLSTTPLGTGRSAFFRAVGPGEVWVAGASGRWQAVALDDDVLYVREDRVLAFDGGVSWEAGAIPGEGLRMLQFRGRGCVVLQLDSPPAAVKVTDDRPVLIASARLYGWVGRLVAHKQRTAGPSPFQLTCQGDGVVMFELQEDGKPHG